MSGLYGNKPRIIGLIDLDVREMMFYQDMLIKLPGSTLPLFEQRLNVFEKLIGAACCDFIGTFGLDEYVRRHVYLTAKNLYQPANISINRPGWHTDGFGTDDITYIWSNAIPTEFCAQYFQITDNDSLSMIEMEQQARPENIITFDNFSLLQIDRYNVHRPRINGHATMRAFCKVIFSKDRFDLLGNSINPLIDYKWDFRPRLNLRNVPQELDEPESEK